jgi:hypothetical protein
MNERTTLVHHHPKTKSKKTMTKKMAPNEHSKRVGWRDILQNSLIFARIIPTYNL